MNGYHGGRFHMFAFSQTTGAAITNTAINGVADGQFTLSTATTFLTPRKGKLQLAASFGATLTRTRLNVPSFRDVGLPSLTPVNASAIVPSPTNICDLSMADIPIKPIDPISVEGTDTAIDTITAMLLMAFDFQPVPIGRKFRLRGTIGAIGVINTWQGGAITLDQALMEGRYAIVGMDLVSANLIAGRLVFADGGYRPGCLNRNAVGSIMHPIFTDGRLGVYGEFSNANIPNIEVLLGGGGAAATAEVFLDVVRIGDNPPV